MKTNQRKPKARILLLFLFSSLMLASCKKGEQESGNAQPVVDAAFSGKVHAPSGKAIGSAEILAGIYKTVSDKNGDFVLPVAAGTYKLVIQTGGGHVFKTEINTSIESKQTISLSYVQTELK